MVSSLIVLVMCSYLLQYYSLCLKHFCLNFVRFVVFYNLLHLKLRSLMFMECLCNLIIHPFMHDEHLYLLPFMVIISSTFI